MRINESYRHDTAAMFFPERDEAWYRRPRDYMLHPQHEHGLKTLALIELDMNDNDKGKVTSDRRKDVMDLEGTDNDTCYRESCPVSSILYCGMKVKL
jgi:hypothetical protein